MMRLSILRRWLLTGFALGWSSIALVNLGNAAGSAVQSAMGDLSEFESPPANWSVAGNISGDLRHNSAITLEDGAGLWVNRPDEHLHGDLITTWLHDDLIVEFDYLLTAGSSAVISFQGRYDVTLPHTRASGLWQHARIEFQAPRFDPAGNQTAEARLISLKIDGIAAPQNSSWDHNAVAEDSTPVAGLGEPGPNPTQGPLIIRGDHGPLVLRRFAVQHLNRDQVALQNLHHRVYQGTFDQLGDTRHQTPSLSGEIEEINETLADTTDAFVMIVSGELVIPRAGWYQFQQETDSISSLHLEIDGQAPTAVGTEGKFFQIRLARGTHPFQLSYLRPGERGKPLIAWSVTGPDMPWQPLSFSAANPPNPIPVVPVTIEPGRVHTHRCFFPYADNKRLYVAAVGTHDHVHYAYDLEWQNLLAVWRGDYLDASGIWHERGKEQIVRPLGGTTELGSGPLFAVLENPDDPWPDPEATAREAAGEAFDPDDNGSGPPTALINLPSPLVSQGYTLAPDGQPTFQLTAYGITVEDHWEVLPHEQGLERTLVFSQPLDRADLHLLLAQENTITAQEDYYVLGDRKAYLEWPSQPTLAPTIHDDGAHQQLRIHLPLGTQSVTYRLIW